VLLCEQHPDLAALPLVRIGAGWDNEIYRLGEQLAVRLPRRMASVQLIAHEQRWLTPLAATLPLAVPAPRRLGVPSERFPAPWSIVPWLEGETADARPVRADQAGVLAAFLRALHVPAPPQAPLNPFRGVSLQQRADFIAERLVRRGQRASLPARIRASWAAALEAVRDVPVTWIHGDLHARNVLVGADGRLSAVLDWGDMCAGDRATDLAAIWILLDSIGARRAAMSALGGSEATWARARGWAVLFGLVLADLSDSAHALTGERTLRHLEEGP